MPNEKLRRRLAYDAARLIYLQHESDPYRAVLRAAGKAIRGWIKPDEFPSESEIRFHVQKLSWMQEGDARFDNSREVRQEALALMRRLERFRPRGVGSVVSGDVRRATGISLYVFADDPGDVARELTSGGGEWLADEREWVRDGRRIPLVVFQRPGAIAARVMSCPVELARKTIVQRSTGERLPQLSLAGMERLFRREYPDVADGESKPRPRTVDRFEIYRMLLGPLASVEQRKSSHPEGDALYHSLQVFELARNELPYDEEFLLAALLHDVGKALDPMHHVEAGLAALNGHITERTGWLIANHTDAHRLLGGTIGARAKRRLQQSEDYDELLRLAHCDRKGRVPGGAAPDIDGALDYIREVARMCDE